MNIVYRVIHTKQFKKDIKKLVRSRKKHLLDKIKETIKLLQYNKTLPLHLRNHKLQGDLSGLEECHVANDWLLVYKRCDKELVLSLVHTGSHSDIFG